MKALRISRRGFTLIEVLVALTVMAVLAGLAWRGIDVMIRARDGTQDSLARTTRLNTVIAQWEQDLQAVFDTVNVPALSFDGQTLRLVRRAESGAGGVRLVAWARREGVLMRWASPVLTRSSDLQEQWLRSQQLLGNEPEQVRLLEGVDDWQVYFYRGGARTNAQSSADLAPAAAPPAPPPPPAPGASAPGGAATAVARELLPEGVELQLQLPEGALRRLVVVVPQP